MWKIHLPQTNAFLHINPKKAEVRNRCKIDPCCWNRVHSGYVHAWILTVHDWYHPAENRGKKNRKITINKNGREHCIRFGKDDNDNEPVTVRYIMIYSSKLTVFKIVFIVAARNVKVELDKCVDNAKARLNSAFVIVLFPPFPPFIFFF